MNVDWTALLEKDEKILWQGRPYTGLVLGIEMIAVAIFVSILFLFTFVFAWALSSQTNLFWPMTIVGFLLALFISIAIPLYDMWERRRTFYALTNKRALQHGSGFKRAQNIKKEDWNHLKLIESNPPSVEYARVSTSFSKMRSKRFGPNQQSTVGFWRISEAKHVYELMLKAIENNY